MRSPFLILVALLILGAADAGFALDKDTIIAAWAKRAQNVRTASFECTAATFLPKRSQQDLIDPDKKWPVHDEERAYRERLIFDDVRIRADTETAKKTDWIFASFNASTGRTVGLNGAPKRIDDDFPHAGISRQDEFRHPHYRYLAPILWSYRITTRAFVPQVDTASLALADRTEIVDDRRCQILTQRTSPVRQYEYWVAPELDFSVVRRVRLNKGRPASETHVSYERDEQFGWTPTAWRLLDIAPDGKITEITTVAVQKYSINEQISEEAFAVGFPAGTIVFDRINDVQYLELENGERRMILPHEKGATYEQIRNSPSGEALQKDQNARGR